MAVWGVGMCLTEYSFPRSEQARGFYSRYFLRKEYVWGSELMIPS
jgi:hypothetical protein